MAWHGMATQADAGVTRWDGPCRLVQVAHTFLMSELKCEYCCKVTRGSGLGGQRNKELLDAMMKRNIHEQTHLSRTSQIGCSSSAKLRTTIDERRA